MSAGEDDRPLWERMRELSVVRRHPRAGELSQAANRLEDAVVNKRPVPELVGAWARARRIWCDCTGEPLV